MEMFNLRIVQYPDTKEWGFRFFSDIDTFSFTVSVRENAIKANPDIYEMVLTSLKHSILSGGLPPKLEVQLTEVIRAYLTEKEKK